MAVKSVRAHSFATLDANIGMASSMRNRALLADSFDIEAKYNEEEISGHNGFVEVMIGNNPVLTGTFKGRILQMSGTFSAAHPMSAIHKGYVANITAENDHSFGVTAAATGYFIFSGKLSLGKGTLNTVDGTLRWFGANTDDAEKVATPSAPV